MSFLQPSGPVIDLGVNIDHVATLRNARGTAYPDPIRAALLAEQAGADAITLHLREDRRHIKDADVIAIAPQLLTRMNLEAAVTQEMIDFACRIRPAIRAASCAGERSTCTATRPPARPAGAAR